MPRQKIDRDGVVTQAIELVDGEGVDELALARVADELGVQASALYNHVAGLDGLRQAVVSRASDNLASCLKDAAVGRADDAALHAVATAYRDFASEHPGQYASTLLPTTSSIDTAIAPQAIIVGVIARILESYGLVETRAIHAARIVRSAIHGFVTLEASDSFTNPHDTDESFAELIDFIARGLQVMAADRTEGRCPHRGSLTAPRAADRTHAGGAPARAGGFTGESGPRTWPYVTRIHLLMMSVCL